MGDALMAALIDGGAIDPFVSIDAGTNCLLVEVVVEAEGQAGALGGGAAVIDTALQAGGVEKRVTLRRPTVRTEDVVPGQQPGSRGITRSRGRPTSTRLGRPQGQPCHMRPHGVLGSTSALRRAEPAVRVDLFLEPIQRRLASGGGAGRTVVGFRPRDVRGHAGSQDPFRWREPVGRLGPVHG
jgi:hypothetical protein